MPVTLQDPINSSIANGVTTVFPYQFLIPSSDAIAVEVDGAVITTGFTVSGVGNPAGGNITFSVAPANGKSIVRYRDLDAKRDFDWSEGGDLLASTHDANDDYAIMLIQQLLESINRAPRLRRGSVLAGAGLEFPAPGAMNYIRWNAGGTFLEAVPSIADAGTFLQSGVGAQLLAANAKLAERVSLYDFLTPAQASDARARTLLVDISARLQLALDECEDSGRTLYVPYGYFRSEAPCYMAERIGIECDRGATFKYYDTAVPASFFLMLGASDTRYYNHYIRNMELELATITARGFDLLNVVNACFDNTSIQGPLHPDWTVFLPPADMVTLMSARDTVGVRIGCAPGHDSFWNTFRKLWINHLHTGVQCPGGGAWGASTQMFFSEVTAFGDTLYGDLTAAAFVFQNCHYSELRGGYFEAYYSGAGGPGTGVSAAIQLVGTAGIKGSGLIFDYSPDVFNVHGGGAGNPIPMNMARLTNLAGVYANGTDFRQITSLPSATMGLVDDCPASRGNFFANNPTKPGVPWTAVLTDFGGGATFTLTAGAGGNLCYQERIDRKTIVWGVLTVAAVVGVPNGRLFIEQTPGGGALGIPMEAMNIASNMSPVQVYVTNPVSKAGGFQAYMNVGPLPIIEIVYNKAGAVPGDTATEIQAGTVIAFRCEYIGREIL